MMNPLHSTNVDNARQACALAPYPRPLSPPKPSPRLRPPQLRPQECSQAGQIRCVPLHIKVPAPRQQQRLHRRRRRCHHRGCVPRPHQLVRPPVDDQHCGQPPGELSACPPRQWAGVLGGVLQGRTGNAMPTDRASEAAAAGAGVWGGAGPARAWGCHGGDSRPVVEYPQRPAQRRAQAAAHHAAAAQVPAADDDPRGAAAGFGGGEVQSWAGADREAIEHDALDLRWAEGAGSIAAAETGDKPAARQEGSEGEGRGRTGMPQPVMSHCSDASASASAAASDGGEEDAGP